MIALLTEAWLAQQPWAGSDIKALVTRHHRHVEVTACVPALAGHLQTSTEFRELLTDAERTLAALIADHSRDIKVEVRCNTKENSRGGPLSDQYFTVSGSAVDYGEDGLVGRGNSRHGLISPAHAAGNEVTFGKNPTYHVGKVGAWLADRAATALARALGPCRVGLVWRIGADYTDPATVQITTADPGHPEWDPVAAEDIVREALGDRTWLDDLVAAERYRPRIEPVAGLLAELGHVR